MIERCSTAPLSHTYDARVAKLCVRGLTPMLFT